MVEGGQGNGAVRPGASVYDPAGTRSHWPSRCKLPGMHLQSVTAAAVVTPGRVALPLGHAVQALTAWSRAWYLFCPQGAHDPWAPVSAPP